MLLPMIISLFVKYCQVVVSIVFWVPKNLASNIWYFSVTLNEGLEGGKQSVFLLYVHLLHLLQLQLLLYTPFLYRLCFKEWLLMTVIEEELQCYSHFQKIKTCRCKATTSSPTTSRTCDCTCDLGSPLLQMHYFSTTAFWSVEATYGGSKSESEEVTPFLFCDVGPVFPV